jgi:hypothetical protein
LQILRADPGHVPLRLDDGNRAVYLAREFDVGRSMLDDVAIVRTTDVISLIVE